MVITVISPDVLEMTVSKLFLDVTKKLGEVKQFELYSYIYLPSALIDTVQF